MTRDCPRVNAPSLYSVIETCSLLEIHRNSLTNYTRAGLIKCVTRPNGRRYYKGSEIVKFWNKTI